jgi:ribonuclease G
MPRELIISANAHEKKVAILEDGVVTEFYVERVSESTGVVGNIYKGRVMKVLPGMQSAFVDIGLERDAFLYVSDFLDVFEDESVDFKEEGRREPAKAKPAPVETVEHVEAPLLVSEVEQVVDEEHVEGADEEGDGDRKRRRRRRRRRRADDVPPGADDYEVPAIVAAVEEPHEETAYAHIEEVEFHDEITAAPVVDPHDIPRETPQAVFVAVRDDDLPPREEVAEEAPKPSKRRARGKATETDAERPARARGKTKAEPAEKKGRARTATGPEIAEKGRARKSRSKKAAGEDAAPADVRVGELSDVLAGAPAFERISDDEPVELSADRSAEVSSVASRAELATRRGGRSRRRRPEGESEPVPVEEEGEPVEMETAEPEEPHARGRRPRRGGNGKSGGGKRVEPLISDLLREGQEIIVQIAKEPIAKKGARITSHVVLPGRFLVYMPTMSHVGVSRKVGSDTERQRLKKVVAALREREGGTGGFIARTAAVGQSEQDLHDDMRYLLRTWTEIKGQGDRKKAPAPLHRDLDLVQRILRDQLSDDFTAIRVDNEMEYARIVDFVHKVQPRLVRRVKLHTRDESILETYGVQGELDKAVKPRVWLKSGGYIVINQTEALVSIDVNTGKFVGKSDRLEDTITRTNMEAVKEIVRQVRLRDLGGIIVIDFIDMEERRNRQKVMLALEQELRADRSPSKVLGFNDFGLIIITRKRVRQSLERTLCSPCPYCQGAGLVKSTQTMSFEILSEARRLSKHIGAADDVTLRVSPEVAHALRSSEAAIFEEIEAYFNTPVRVKADPELHQEQFDFALL